MENPTRFSKKSSSIDTEGIVFGLACLFVYFTAVFTVFFYEDAEQINNPDLEILNSDVEAAKVQDDPGFDVFINSHTRGDDLVAEFYHNSENPQPISVIGLEGYQLSKNEASNGEKILLKVPGWNNRYFKLQIGHDSEIFEFGIKILNVQSYPVVGGKWTVKFETRGTADLTIKAVNGTTWSNVNGNNDLKFLEIKCKDKVLDYRWVNNSVFIENYSCNGTGYETSKVLTSGKHTIEVKFGNIIKYAKNYASVLISSTPIVDTNWTQYWQYGDFNDTGYNSGEELPDNKNVETWPCGANMTGNVLLLHLNSVNASNYTLDSSGEGNDGFFNTSGEDPQGKVVSGKFNNALSFDGVDDYVDCGNDSSLDITDNITIELWFYSRGWSHIDFPAIISKREADPGFDWELYYWRDGSRIGFDDGSGAKFIDLNVNPSLNTWHHVVITKSGTTGTLYLDGVSKGTNTLVSSFGTGDSVRIGTLGTDALDRCFNGSIDEVAIFNRSLSSDEILDHYRRGLSSHITLNHSNGAFSYSGDFTSAVFDTDSSVQWDNISWISNAMGELPDNQQPETKFVNGNANMTGNVLLMHMDEDSSGFGRAIIDTSGGGNNGTTYGDTDGTVSGKFDKGNYFDGSDDYIEVPFSSSLNITNAITIETWAKAKSPKTVQSDYPRLVSRGWVDSYELTTDILEDNGSVSFFLWNSTGDPFFAKVYFDIFDDQWHHIVGTWNGSQMMIYIDGVGYPGNTFIGSIATTSTNLTIARAPGAAPQYLNGTIDEVAIYNRSLSAEEILNHHKRGILRLNLTVRSCDDPACSGESWTDVDDNSPQSPSIIDNQYFQYKFRFETDNASYTPVLYNVTIHYGLQDTMPPTATLNSPSNSTTDTDGNVTFTCSATDNSALTNITLYVWNSTGIYYANTTSISGTSNQTSWNIKSMPDDGYTWNCIAYDNVSQIDWADANRSLTLMHTNVTQAHYRWRADDGGEGNWYNANWPYRKEVSLNGNGTSGTDYQIKIVVGNITGNVNCSGHCQEDFDDIRFIDDDGVTELDYWRESYTASNNATFWVEIRDNLSSGNNPHIYVYYGNFLVESASNGTNTFIFFDDFNYAGPNLDSDKWFTDGTGIVNITNNELYVKTTASWAYAKAVTKNTIDISDKIIELRWKVIGAGTSGEECEVAYSATGLTDSWTIFRKNGFLNRDLKLYTLQSGSSAQRWDSANTVTIGTYYRYRFVDNGSSVEVHWLNDDYSEIENSGFFNRDPGIQHIQLKQGTTNDEGVFDDIRVRKYSANEPTTGTVESEQSYSGATWKAAEDTAVTNQSKNENVRLRFSVKNTGGQAEYCYLLQVSQKTAATCEDQGTGWSGVPTNSSGCGSAVACMTSSTYFNDDDNTTNQLTSEGAWTPGRMVEDPSNLTCAITLNQDYFTELEYNFQLTDNSVGGATYCFRVANLNMPIDNYTTVAAITTGDTTPPNVTLITPQNDTTDTDCNVTFTCNATDIGGLANIALYVWNSTGGLYYNNTKTISGASNQSAWNLTGMLDDDYMWNCLAYDSAGNSNWADDNWTLRILHVISVHCTTGAEKNEFDIYAPGEEYACANGTSDGNASIYVCDNRTWSDNDPLDDTYNCVNVVNVSGSFSMVNLTSFDIGSYDIVLDNDMDGYYNATRDAVDDVTAESGFIITPQPGTFALVLIGLSVLLLFYRINKKTF